MAMSVQIDDPGAEPEAEGEGRESIVAEINITPLTDVFLVLLIIFMVTSTAIVESEVASRTGSQGCSAQGQRGGRGHQAAHRSRPDRDEEQRALSSSTARSILRTLKKRSTRHSRKWIRRPCFCAGDKSVFLGAAVDLMAVAKKAGAKNIAILTQSEQKP